MFPMVRPAITQEEEREREREDERQHCYHPFNHGLCCLTFPSSRRISRRQFRSRSFVFERDDVGVKCCVRCIVRLKL